MWGNCSELQGSRGLILQGRLGCGASEQDCVILGFFVCFFIALSRLVPNFSWRPYPYTQSTMSQSMLFLTALLQQRRTTATVEVTGFLHPQLPQDTHLVIARTAAAKFAHS